MKKKTVAGLVLSIIAIITIIITIAILLNGKTKTFGKNPEDVQGQSLVCISQDIVYPLFSYDNSKFKELKIVTNFYNHSVNAISLIYTLNYDNDKQITISEAINHADMNNSFSKNGLAPDSYNAHYSKMDGFMRMSLYTTSDSMDILAARYFMFKTDSQERMPVTITEYQKIYRQQGFNCEVND